LLLGLSSALLLTACSSSTPAAAPVRSAPATVDEPGPDEECPIFTVRDGAGATQAPDGHLSGCFRVGPVQPGPYTLQLEQSLDGDHGAPRPDGGIKLSPAKGPPGTTVEISGFSPRTPGAETPNNAGRVCWDGCERGFSHYEPVQWSPGGHFTTHLQVPAIPWLSVDGPHPLRSGDYRIGLQCIPTCDSKPAEALFRLQTGGPEACVDRRPCAHLEITPESARPGEVVRIRGWAPLVPPPRGGYRLHVEEGHTEKPAVEVLRGRDGATVRLSSARFSAQPGRSWAELPPRKPVVQFPGRPGLAAEAGKVALLAHCVPDGIRISRDRGVHWEVIETRTAPMAAQGTGYKMASTGPVHCGAPVPDPRHRDSAFAQFSLAREDVEPPPFYTSGFFTVDGGRTWRPVPVPPGASMENFDGFALSGGFVLARFHHRPEPSQWAKKDNAPARDWEPGLLVLETSDGGRHWRPGRDRCPTQGPCVTWGPTAEYGCAKGRSWRLLRTSGDGGRTWSSAQWPGWVATCGPASIAIFPSGDVALLSADELAAPFPLLVSHDAGQTWEPIELPALPDAAPTFWRQFPNLTLLGDGRLLGFAYPSGPQLLDPGADRWCAVRGERPGPLLDAHSHYEPIADRLWWIDYRTQAVRSLPYRDLRCR
jgi:hypothetical protein